MIKINLSCLMYRLLALILPLMIGFLLKNMVIPSHQLLKIMPKPKKLQINSQIINPIIANAVDYPSIITHSHTVTVPIK